MFIIKGNMTPKFGSTFFELWVILNNSRHLHPPEFPPMKKYLDIFPQGEKNCLILGHWSVYYDIENVHGDIRQSNKHVRCCKDHNIIKVIKYWINILQLRWNYKILNINIFSVKVYLDCFSPQHYSTNPNRNSPGCVHVVCQY